jgi:four helix bundle protein
MDKIENGKSTRINTFRDLIVWRKAIDFVTSIYKLTTSFPTNELYGLSLQIRRCAVSIPSNIAEGYGRRSTKDYIRFLNIAMGSIYELQTQLEIGLNLNFISKSNYESNYKKIREIEIILRSLITKIHQSNLIT